MHKVKVSKFSFTRKLPENWSELKTGSLNYVLKVLLISEDPYVAKLQILKKLLRIKSKTFRKLSPAQLAEMISLLDWMDISKLTIPIFPVIKWRGKTYHMPAQKFDNGTAFQYAAADDALINFQRTKDPIYLDQLIAILLMRNKNPLSTNDEVERSAPIFSQLPQLKRLAILAYFNGIKQFIYETYAKWIFTTANAAEEESKVNFRWFGRYMEVAKTGVFGDVEKVHHTRFHDICVFLVQEKENYLAEKKRIESKSNS